MLLHLKDPPLLFHSLLLVLFQMMVLSASDHFCSLSLHISETHFWPPVLILSRDNDLRARLQVKKKDKLDYPTADGPKNKSGLELNGEEHSRMWLIGEEKKTTETQEKDVRSCVLAIVTWLYCFNSSYHRLTNVPMFACVIVWSSLSPYPILSSYYNLFLISFPFPSLSCWQLLHRPN